MAKGEYSSYQKGVIGRYYENRDNIMLQKLQELVTELYLVDSDKKEDRLWERVEKAMKNLKVNPKIREHIMRKRNVKVLAENLQGWLRK
jgi:hypothetical protein